MGYVRTWDKGHQGAVWGWELHWDKNIGKIYSKGSKIAGVWGNMVLA